MQSFPGEVISKIMRENNQSHITRILSKNSKLLSQADFLETTCRKNISLNEIKRYMTKEVAYGYILVPNILHHHSVELFLEFYVWTPFPWGRDVDENNSVHITSIPTVYITYAIMGADTDLEIINDEYLRLDHYVDNGDSDLKAVEFITNYKIEDNVIYNTVIEDYDDISMFDLLTTYRILKDRESCHALNSSFAYNESLRIFHQFINTHQEIIHSLTLFGYLYINMKVMNLPYSGPSILSSYSRNEIDKYDIDNYIINHYQPFIDYIPTMILAIEKYLYVINQYDI